MTDRADDAERGNCFLQIPCRPCPVRMESIGVGSMASFVQSKFRLPKKSDDRNLSYGQLDCPDFPERRPFLRLDGRRIDTDYMDDVYQLLTRYWKIPEPNFVLQVTGSAEELTNLTDAQKNSLKKAVQNQVGTHASGKVVWVVTGGSDSGCMRLVGEALQDKTDTAPCIGFATWSNQETEDLERMSTSGGEVITYKNGTGNKKKLNLNHRCFLLFDTETEEQPSMGPGQEIEFRNKFLDYVSNEKFKEPLPAGLLLIGGGINSLNTTFLTVAAQQQDLNAGRFVATIPLIVFKATGRSANAIEIAVEFCKKTKEYSFVEFKNAMLEQPEIIKGVIAPPWIKNDEILNAGFSRAIQRVAVSSVKLFPPPFREIEDPDQVDGAIEWVLSTMHNIAMRRHLVTLVNGFDENEKPPHVLEIEEEISSQLVRTKRFVENNFVPPRCKFFVKISDEEIRKIEPKLLETLNADNLCECGRDDHSNIPETIQCGVMKFCLPEGEDSLSAASMEFVPSYSKFIRLGYKTPRDEVLFFQQIYALMTEFWRMPVPQLLIEITGTAEDMRLVDSDVLKDLRIGLIRVAKKAKAWLIAGGTNCGIMKLVGDAVANDRKTHNSFSVPCLGIAPWGMMENRYEVFKQQDDLLMQKYGLVHYPFKNDENYIDRKERGNQFELNPGYDHIILVDTSRENRFAEEIEFRTKLLSYLSEQRPYKSKHPTSQTPLVLLVLGGGPGTLKTVCEAIKTEGQKPRPVVILKGFGGCGDFLATVYECLQKLDGNVEKEVKDNRFFKQIVEQDNAKRGVEVIYTEIKSKWEMIFANPSLTITLDMTPGESQSENKKSLDDAILEAIFKRDPVELGTQAIKSTFELALLWNRVDFAKRIISDRQSFNIIQKEEKNSRFVNKAMTFAIKRNQAKLFDLFISSGLIEPWNYFVGGNERQIAIILHKLFWHPSAWSPYTKVVSRRHLHFFQQLVDQGHSSTKLGPDQAFRLRYNDSDSANEKLDDISNTVEPVLRTFFRLPPSINLKIRNSHSKKRDKDLQFEIAVRNLFLIKLLLCRDDFAVAIWRVAEVSDFLGTAVMASIFLEKLAEAADSIHRRDLCETYQELSIKWEQRSLALIQKLSEMQPKSLSRILTRSLRTWHGINVLQMAYHGEKMSVMAHSAVQIELEKVWKGHWPSDKDEQQTPSASKPNGPVETACTKQIVQLFANLRNPNRQTVAPADGEVNHVHVEKQPSRYDKWTAEAVARFYETSPEVKFAFHTAFLLLFLLVLFGDVVYSAHEPLTCKAAPSIQMILIWICALMFTADALQEIILFDSCTVDNVTTIIGGISMLTSFILRTFCYYKSTGPTALIFAFSRMFYSFSCIFFWFKCFRILFVWKTLGPKVLTFYEMFKSVGFFTILHFIILFGFAGPIYALSTMPENRDGHGDTNEYLALMARVIYSRWWQIVSINMDDSQDNALGEYCTKDLSPENTFGEIGNSTAYPNDTATSIFGPLLQSTTTTTPELPIGPETFCDFRNVIASILLMVFLLLTNIVLLNMLIADFSHTVESFREKAEILWKFGRFHLISSFAEKPVLPPPLNFFELLFVNANVFGRCLSKKWSKSLETHFNDEADTFIEIEGTQDKQWKNKFELAKFRYRELNFLEKTAVSKVMDTEEGKER